MAKMTVKQVEALKAEKKPYKRSVDTGLMMRVSASGIKTWIVQYVVDGVQRDYALPKPWGQNSDEAHMSLADARAEAERLRALARQGIDYKKKLEHERAADAKRITDEAIAAAQRVDLERSENLTLKDLFDAWITDGVRRKDGNAELQRQFNADVLPAIGAIAMRDITEHDLRGVLRAMVDRGVNRSAVMVRNSLTQMFAWGRKRQPWRKLLVEGDPMELIEIEKIVSPEYDMEDYRDRVLSAHELRELRDIIAKMHADFDDAPDQRATSRPLAPTTERAIWIMLSTLCRVSETCKARWANVNLDTGEWFIPKADVKDNLADLTVYLSDFALAQFKLLHERTGHTAWCFPSRLKDGPVEGKAISKQLGDRQSMFKKDKDGGPRKPMKNRKHDNTLVLAAGKNGSWSAHDLRRTGATMMQAMGVQLDTIDRCQNHVIKGSKVRRSYLHHDYADEKRAAWLLLGARLEAIFAE